MTRWPKDYIIGLLEAASRGQTVEVCCATLEEVRSLRDAIYYRKTKTGHTLSILVLGLIVRVIAAPTRQPLPLVTIT